MDLLKGEGTSNDIGEENEKKFVTGRGIYIYLSRDVGAAVSGMTTNSRYFEYVRYDSLNTLIRKLFVNVGCAITFSASTGFRLYSNKEVDLNVAIFVHSIVPYSVDAFLS